MLRRLNEHAKTHLGASLGKLAFARALYQAIDWTLDNPVYIATIVWLGPLYGFLTMTVVAGLLNSVYLLIYQRTGIDWLGINAVKKAALVAGERDHIQRLWDMRCRWFWLRWLYLTVVALPLLAAQILLWGINRGPIITFIVLSIFQDSFVATAYFRHGKEGPLDRRDWNIFFASLIVSNLWWTLRWGVVIELFRLVWTWTAG